MLNNIDQETMDIDWFFTNTEHVGFVASGAGKLPASISENWEESRQISLFFDELPVTSDIIINPKLAEIINSKVEDEYLHGFVAMAMRGFFAFDKTILGNFSDLSYHLVASPVNPLDFNKLPVEIKTKLIKSRYTGVLSENVNIGEIT